MPNNNKKAVLLFIRKDPLKVYTMFLDEDQAGEFWKLYHQKIKPAKRGE